METNYLYIISALIVGLLFPLYAIANGKKTKDLLIENPEYRKLVFRQTAIILILLTIITIAPFLLQKESLSTIGLDFLDKPLWVISLFIISVASLYLFKSVKFTVKNAQKFNNGNKRVAFLMPTTKTQYKLTIYVSFVAGICEEIIYRGFLYWMLLDYFPLVVAVIVTNVPFALAHLTTTGKKNSFGAFVLGLIFSGAYILTDSLWLPILLHIIVDLYSMTFAFRSHQILKSEPSKTNED
ncbi:CPBP family glutamic-type intramembrane protease [Winogradskyella sp. 3972H.M.0a.05]|uniref:CPBP family intramembrane glutamic endopeptidase n=1 Tax=Winogradskyella sp. 3972H.M.0a.05 TaxID=2950277 RepID=UPI00339B6F9F